MQRRAHALAFQHAPKPTDLVLGLEEGVVAKDGRVLSLDDILYRADR